MARRRNTVADRLAGYFEPTELSNKSESGNTETLEDENPAGLRAKRTYVLPLKTIKWLNRIQNTEFERTGRKPELSDLVAEAVALLGNSKNIPSPDS